MKLCTYTKLNWFKLIVFYIETVYLSGTELFEIKLFWHKNCVHAKLNCVR